MTVAVDVHQLITELPARKRALLTARNPLSFSQERLWFFDQLVPGSPVYNIPFALRLEGDFDRLALEHSLAEVLRRHDALRTTFAAPDGRPMQVVHPPRTAELPIIDLAALAAEEREAQARALVTGEAGRPFDLSRGPLLRYRLLRLGRREHVLCGAMHHIVSDGWSLEVLIREVAGLYTAFAAGEPSPLPELPIQYLDFARWQREQLRGEVLREHLGYWKRTLAGAPPLLELPMDGPRPQVQSHRGASRVQTFSPEIADGLRRVSQRAGATSFATLLAAFMALLGRLTGSDDVVVGSPVANRTREELEPLIGFFVNMLVLRGDLSGDPTFLELLARVREVVVGAQAHQDLPFEKLVEALQPERNLGHAPLFQVAFIHLVPPREERSLPGLRLTQVQGERATAMYDLGISLLETDRGLTSELEYSTDLFSSATVDRFQRQLDALLGTLAADPEQRVSEVPLLSAPERQQLVVEWNDAAASVAPEATLPALLAARAARQPEAAAVVCGEASLTYRELHEQARRLAGRLVGLGIGPETLVGLHAERTPEMLVGLLGILEAGAAYLPLDPALPQERLAWMLEDSRAPVVLTQQRLLGALPAWGGTALCLDGEELAAASPGSGLDRTAAADPDHLAYVLYTSGSTGRPKGVPITHRNVVNFLGFMGPRLGIGEGDTLLAVTTLSFDISVLELVLPLVRGARIALVGPEISTDGERLAQAIARHGATVMQATPSTWQLLIQAGWQGREDLRILCGGEALPGDLARQLLERGREVWNLYGPTETTIWSAVHRVGAEAGVAPLGRPIANTALHVLDRGFRPQPLGVPGELFIGGAGLSRGYLNRSELAAERFVPDPFAGETGARLYRTGDLVRRRPDGVLEFLGRTDHQVKLRGFRIELGEIEAVLREHPAVREAVVVLRQDRAGELVGYVVADPAVPLLELTGQLRALLQQRLPAYMVPAALVALNAMPRTPNGKLNRRALPAPAADDFGADTGYVAPRTPLEEAVARIWAELLGREQVGVESSFFELGGHSLLATRLVHRLVTELQVELRLPQLFAAPTVAGLAAAIARCRAEGDRGAAPSAQRAAIVPDPARRGEPFPLNDVQQAYWVGRSAHFALGNVSSHSYTEIDVPELDVARLERALRRLIDRHDMLRAVVMPDGRQQVLAEVPPYEIRVQDLRGADPAAAAATLEQVRAEMSHQVLSADRWPLFEVRASLLDDGRARLHFSLDYLIADAWSMRIIFRDVFRFYGDPGLELPPLELSFRDCVLAERAQDATETYERAERYWRERLGDLPPAPELPLACDPRELATPRFVRRQARLSAERWGRLKSAAARAGLTPSGVLLGAFSEVLAVWSKSPRFTINVTLFNRPPVHPDVEEVVGDFTTLSLLAVDASRGNSFVLRARGIQEQLWSDMEHRAVSAVRVLRDLARTQGTAPASIMPVVFTSVLGQGGGEAAGADGTDGEADDSSFGISQTPQVWLDHQVIESRGALVYNWDAVEDLFPAGLLDDLFSAYRGLLDALAAQEDWSAVPRPAPGATDLEIQEAANRTIGPLPDELLHAGFAAQAAREPGRVAVIAPSCTLTYGEVDRRSNQLARRLRDLGAQPNELVAVVMEKGWEQVVAVLAVLKSGAAYLPIDPGLPAKRLQHLLQQGEVRFALATRASAGAVAWPAGIERITVGPEAPSGISDAALEPVQGPRDLAYVIYTSGSTGLPKGVMIDHRGAANTVIDVNERLAIGPEDRTLALSALNFDLSVYDVFGLLAAGGAIVFPDPADLRDPEAWAELVERHGVTVWNTVPALLEMLVEGAPAAARLGSLRLALLSGDWIPVTLPDRFRARVDGVEVISLGGATEASIWSILYPIGEVDPAWPSIPYGKAMRNQRFYVLDHALEPRPLSVPGELYIGGVGVALGYWRDEERTAVQFVRHPRTGERLYRTGDLGRFLPDGNIEFLGREDFQVKVRGHRIELGEIEAALHQIENVRAAVVATAGASQTDRRLVAYVVLDQPAPAAAPQTAPAPRPAALPAAGPATDSEEIPAFAPVQGEIAKLEFKLAEHGLRRDEGRPALPLAAPAVDEAFLTPYRERRTHRAFREEPLPGERLGRLLASLRKPGGARPVEIHVQVRPGRIEGLAAGTYRYDPATDRLACTALGADIDPRWHEAVNQEVARQAAFAIYLIARPDALVAAYGDAARESALLEAGSLGQLLMEAGPAAGIGLCPIGGLALQEAPALLGLDPSCVLLHSFLGGGLSGDTAAETAVPAAPEVFDLAVKGDFLDERLSAGAFGSWLASLRQVLLPELPIPKYRYASAGALYPVQTYVVVEPGRIEGVEAGVYYYDPKGHRLVRLAEGAEVRPALAAAGAAKLPGGTAFSLFLIGRLGAIAPLYGGVARDFCQLEAGYMSQLLAAAGRGLGVGLAPAACPGFRESRRSFALDRDHVLLHVMTGGPVAAAGGAARSQRLELPDEAARLRSRLGEVLPEYSVPTQIVFLAELPLTANGKVDRQGLPAPGETTGGEAAVQGTAQDPSAAPRSEMERTIAAIWSEMLGREQVGVHDNFFELGGTSVHMIRMRNRLQEKIGRTVEVTEFFQHPTVAALARALARSAATESEGETTAELDDVDERMQKQKSALLRQRMAAQQRMKAAE